DVNNEFFRETFEGVVRRILTAESKSALSRPALFMFNNVQYNDGVNAEEVHNEIGRAYHLPIVTMKASIYEEIAAGRLKADEITPDNLHPNDRGHKMVADVICNLLEKIFCAVSGSALDGKESPVVIDDRESGAGHFVLRTGNEDTLSTGIPRSPEITSLRNVPFSQDIYEMPEQPVTKNRFENSVRYQNPDFADGSPAGMQLKASGFTADHRPQEYGVADVFKNGWSAMEEGSFLETTVEASNISVQFRRTIKKPAPVARAVVDGDEANAVLLDANFDETWGDCCYLKDIAMGLPFGKHTLRITIVQKPEQPENDFYLISILCA
nr:hypothetical protein [Lachnospiraceae bacterium]